MQAKGKRGYAGDACLWSNHHGESPKTLEAQCIYFISFLYLSAGFLFLGLQMRVLRRVLLQMQDVGVEIIFHFMPDRSPNSLEMDVNSSFLFDCCVLCAVCYAFLLSTTNSGIRLFRVALNCSFESSLFLGTDGVH